MRKFIVFLLCFCLLGGVTAFAEPSAENALSLNSKSVVLMETDTGKILYEGNSDIRLPPASITKIMSLILIIEAIEDGRFSLDTVLVCSDTAAALGGSQIWLETGEEMTVDDLLKAVVIVSANDATVLLAEAVAGSEESFVALMNRKARLLGMNNTNFCNATGLDAEGHYSSAYDVAIMASELLRHKIITDYSTVWMDTLRNGKSELVNTNRLVRFYEGCTGLKTGTTSTAGYCLAASAERNGLSLVAVVMNADSSNNRFFDAQKLLNYGFANYSYVTLVPELSGNEKINVNGGVKKEVSVKAEGELSVVLKKNEVSSVTQKTFMEEYADAPINAGDFVGKTVFYCREDEIGYVDITVVDDCEKMTFLKALKYILNMLFVI